MNRTQPPRDRSWSWPRRRPLARASDVLDTPRGPFAKRSSRPGRSVLDHGGPDRLERLQPGGLAGDQQRAITTPPSTNSSPPSRQRSGRASNDPRLVARSYADYAWALQKQGRNAEAEPLLKWVLVAREATLEPDLAGRSPRASTNWRRSTRPRPLHRRRAVAPQGHRVPGEGDEAQPAGARQEPDPDGSPARRPAPLRGVGALLPQGRRHPREGPGARRIPTPATP